jgi:hypothetical protein
LNDPEVRFGEEDDPFHHPEFPYYYKLKNNENIYDETLNVKDRESFIIIVRTCTLIIKTMEVIGKTIR